MADTESELARRLVDAVAAETAESIVEILVSAPEARRRAVRDHVRRELATLLPPREQVRGRRRCAALVMLGLSTASELRGDLTLGWGGVDAEAGATILRARPANLRRAIVARALTDELTSWLWPVGFQFVRSGDVERPDDPAFRRSAARHLLSAPYGPWTDGDPADALFARWVQDDLIDEVVVALQTEEGAMTASEQSPEILPRAVQLAVACGALGRDRALDLCLEGFLSDFRLRATRAFGRVWNRLEPTDGELIRRSTLLGQVAAASDPGGQTLAIAALHRVAASCQPDDMASAAANGLQGTTKKLAQDALELLEEVAARSPDAAAEAALVGLGHPRHDVQAAALALVERLLPDVHDVDAVRAGLLAWSDGVEPQLRGRVLEVAGFADPESSGHRDVDIDDLRARCSTLPADLLDLAGLPDVDLARPPDPLSFAAWSPPTGGTDLSPIADTTELVEIVAAIIDGSADGIDLERALDALARFGADVAADRATEAIRRRFEQGPLANSLGTRAGAVTMLVQAWLHRRPPPTSPALRPARTRGILRRRGPDLAWDLVSGGTSHSYVEFAPTPNPAGFLDGRLWELAHLLAAGRRQPLLATPSHRAGWVTADRLADRLDWYRSHDVAPGRFDACQAVLRLHPTVDRIPSERLAASTVGRAAIAVSGPAPNVDDEGLLRAARRCPSLGPVGVRVLPSGRTHWPDVTTLLFPDAEVVGPDRADDPAGLLIARVAAPPYALEWWDDAGALLVTTSSLHTSASLLTFPRAPHLVAAAFAVTAARDTDSNRTSEHAHLVLRHFVHPDVPLGPEAHLAVSVALAARNDTTATVAVDVVVVASADGRLDAECIGRQLAMLSDRGVVGLGRAAVRLQMAARSSVLHADTVRRVWVSALRALDDVPRDVHAALECLLAAGSRCGRGIDDDAARDAVVAMSAGSSKRAALARDVLALPNTWNDATAEMQAISGRIDRAERWLASRRS